MRLFAQHNALRTCLSQIVHTYTRIELRHIRSLAFKSAPREMPLTTLDPRRLTPSDFRSPAGNFTFRIKCATENITSQVRFKREQINTIPFPSEAQGFFYYYPGPAHAPIAGGLRFRVVPSKDPAEFDHGYDLAHPRTCLPWSIPVPALLAHKAYTAVASLILQCNDLVPIASSVLAGIKETNIPMVNLNASIIHSLGQPLHADLSEKRICYRIAKGTTLSSKSHLLLFGDPRQKAHGGLLYMPYTGESLSSLVPTRVYTVQKGAETCIAGSILYTLERAPVSDGPPRCHLRVLDIIKPVLMNDSGYDRHIPPPAKGELIRGPGGRVRKIRVPELCGLPKTS
jgi:hypothetical protein